MENNRGWSLFLESRHAAAGEDKFSEDQKRYEEELARNNAEIEEFKARIIAKNHANARYAAENNILRRK